MKSFWRSATHLDTKYLIVKTQTGNLTVTKPSDKAQVCQSFLGRDSIVDCLKVLFSLQDVIQQGRNTLLIYYYKPMI